MADLSDFIYQKLNIGVRMAGVNVTKTAELLGVSRCNVSKVMTAFKKEGKTSLHKQNSGRKRK